MKRDIKCKYIRVIKNAGISNLIQSQKRNNNQMNVLSLFSGIGGLDMGFGGQVIVHKHSIGHTSFIDEEYQIDNFVKLKRHKFNIVFQNDILQGAKEICELNDTAHNYNTNSIYDLLQENFQFPNADVVIGGFPCQDFSHCGKRKGFNSDKSHDMLNGLNTEEETSRGSLYKSFVKIVDKVRPKVFVAENVYGLLTMKNEPIKIIISDFSALGYTVKYQLVNCSEFGVPQIRKRVIIIGISNTHKGELPSLWNEITKNRIRCNVGNYLGHICEPNETSDIAHKIYSKAKRLDKGQGQVEINLQSFAPTIRAEHHGNIEYRRHTNGINVSEHDLEERRLTIREVGLIQTFPPDFIFTKKITMKAYKYIGNAVPPLLSYLIADKVKQLIDCYF